MSYDLYFYKKSDGATVKKGFLGSLVGAGGKASPALDEGGLLSFLASYGHFKEINKTDSGFDAEYHNESTEARAYFTFSRKEATGSDYPGFTHTGLSLNVNYYRPFYYGYEAALAADAICRKFGLYMADPQSRDEAPRARTADEIFGSWDKSNTDCIRGMIARMKAEGKENEETTPDIWSRMSRESSRAYWQYLYHHDSIARYVEDNHIDAYVPTWIFVFQRNADKKLMTSIAFMEGVGYVLPKCDLFDLSLADRSGSGIVKSEALLSQIRGLLKPLGMPGLDLQYLDGESAQKIGDIVRSLNLDDQFAESYKIVRQKNSFVPGVYIDID